jgi:hypothetical protein
VSRLEELGIRKVVEGPAVSLYVRGNCVAAVGSSQGSTGILTESGLAYLVWKGEAPFLASKGGEAPATPEQVQEIQQFAADLKSALTT